jgi:gamma-glutamyltranspeptidase
VWLHGGPNEYCALSYQPWRQLFVARGYTVLERDGYQGRVDAIAIDRAKGWYWGATDPRGYGEAAGY